MHAGGFGDSRSDHGGSPADLIQQLECRVKSEVVVFRGLCSSRPSQVPSWCYPPRDTVQDIDDSFSSLVIMV